MSHGESDMKSRISQKPAETQDVVAMFHVEHYRWWIIPRRGPITDQVLAELAESQRR